MVQWINKLFKRHTYNSIKLAPKKFMIGDTVLVNGHQPFMHCVRFSGVITDLLISSSIGVVVAIEVSKNKHKFINLNEIGLSVIRGEEAVFSVEPYCETKILTTRFLLTETYYVPPTNDSQISTIHS